MIIEGDICALFMANEFTAYVHIEKFEPAEKRDWYHVYMKVFKGFPPVEFKLILSSFHLDENEFTVNSVPHKLVKIIDSSQNKSICEYDNIKKDSKSTGDDPVEQDDNSDSYYRVTNRAIGYCAACGKMSSFNFIDENWQCDKCGYFNSKINDRTYERKS